MTVLAFGLTAALALLVGALMGLLGGGGGFLYVLIILVTTDAAASTAVGTGVATAAFGAAVSLLGHHRGGTVDWPRVPGFLLPGAVAATGAGAVTTLVPERLLIIMIIVGYCLVGILPMRLLRHRERHATPATPGVATPGLAAPGPRRRRAGRAAVGAVAGITVGAFAVNGGPLISAYLTGYERVDPRYAIGTAVAVLTPLSVVAAVTHLAGSGVDGHLLAALAPGAAVGGYLGARLTRLVRTRLLAPVLGLLTIGTMIPLLFR